MSVTAPSDAASRAVDERGGDDEVLVFPVSMPQERLWFLDQLEPDLIAYNEVCAVRLVGAVDPSTLEAGLNEIIRRHDVLRTTFAVVDGQPAQVVSPGLNLVLTRVDLRELPPSRRAQRAEEELRTEARRRFDLTNGPLIRAMLVRLDQEQWIFLLTMHHIISDGWSMRVLFQELSIVYPAIETAVSPDQVDLPIQYADFAVWQRDRLESDAVAELLSFWHEKLRHAPPVLDLPADHSRAASQTYNGARVPVELPAELVDELRAFSRREGVTLYMVLLAAYQILLSRYTGQEDLVIGSPAAGRQVETEDLIGFFLNTLLLRAQVSGDRSFRDLLKQTRDIALETHEHQDIPFEILVERLQAARDPSHPPLFQVMFVLQDAPHDGLTLPGVAAAPYLLDPGTSKLDLILSVMESRHGLLAWFEYNSDLFDADRIERMAGHFRVLLEAVVENPEQQVSALPLLTADERVQLLKTWNATSTGYLRDRCIHQLFEEQVERTPDAVALVFRDRRLSYRELNQRANRLAWHLQRRGVGPEVLVGVCAERSLEMVIGILAILKAGGAYVPLDPSYPKDRLAFMLEDSGASIVLTHGHVPPGPVEGLRLDTADEWCAGEREENPTSGVGPGNLAYVIYTSGSTGRPKGVAIEHHSTVTFLRWAREYFAPDALAGVLASTSICFDLSVFEIFAPLCSGGSAILVQDALALPTLSESPSITLINTVPSAMSELARIGALPSSVNVINLAGEPLQQSLVDQIARSSRAQVINLYGPTEDTTYSTVVPVNAGQPGPPPIGRPIGDTQVYVLDRYMNPVPIGVPGELYLGGEGLARGYLNRPELTNERFVPNPFASAPSARLYRTGDVARYRSDGEIECLGRIDHQVKIRGFRIELGEVEATLRLHPHVEEALVIAREMEAGDKRLVAYVVPVAGLPIDGGELRRWSRDRLPEFMIPSAVVTLTALPLTPNGKVDRAALPAPDRSTASAERDFVAPRTELEREITAIWEAVLGLRPIGVRDDFFSLGGYSLLAVRLFAQIEAATGIRLPLAVLFQGATIEHLAEACERQRGSTAWPSLVPIQPTGQRKPFYCVHPIDGDVVWYAPLAKHLGPDQPVYGLRARGLDGLQAPATSIEQMAAEYVAEIRAFQPEGPYDLGGFSSGGTIVFEMARQLMASGQTVGLVAILDHPPVKSGYYDVHWNTSYALRYARDIPHRLRKFFLERTAESKRNVLLNKLSAFTGLFDSTSETTSRSINSSLVDDMVDNVAGLIIGDVSDLPDHHRRLIRSHCQALVDYVPTSFPGRVTLFRAARQPLRCTHDPLMGWGDLAAGGIDVHVVHGWHLSIIHEPDVQDLARALSRCLAAAQRN